MEGCGDALGSSSQGQLEARASDWVPLVSSAGQGCSVRAEKGVFSVLEKTKTSCSILGGGCCAAQAKVKITCSNQRMCILVGRLFLLLITMAYTLIEVLMRQLYLQLKPSTGAGMNGVGEVVGYTSSAYSRFANLL